MSGGNCEVMGVTGMSDTELISLLREHPEEGCRQLLSQYTGTVLAVVRRRLGGCTFCTAEDMEELASDILFRFWQQRERVSEEKGSIRALLSTMAARASIDWYRAHAKKLGMQSEDPLPETLADPVSAPDEAYLTKERRDLLLQAVRSLGEPDTEILIRKYYGGETAAAIAERLSMRTGTVEMRISRALQKLRRMMGGAEHDD